MSQSVISSEPVFDPTILAHFWARVDKREPNECWEWQAGIDKDGYGKLSVNRKDWKAHRFSWMTSYGNVPNGLHVCHTCDNRRCVNPAHLFLGTNADNMKDKIEKGHQTRGSEYVRSKLTEADIPKIIELYNKGKSQCALGKIFGVQQTTISLVLRRERWTHVEVSELPRLRRRGGGSRKLTWDTVDAIREAFSKGAKTKDLAQQFGISPRSIRDIIGGKTW